MEQFKIAEAYVEFKGKGNVEEDTRKAKSSFDDATQSRERGMQRIGREDERMSRAKKQMDASEKGAAKLKMKDDQEATDRRTASLMKIGLATRALGAIPGARGAGELAAAYQLKGAGGALAAGAAAGVAYGIGGAAKASPQAFAQMQFQADRLQAIVGQSFVPIIEKLGTGLERFSNLLGGKGAQLNMPQLGNFESMRDRLQMEAVAGMAGGGGGTSGLGTLGGAFAGGKFGAGIGARFGPWGAVIGGGAGAIVGGVAGDSVEALASRGYRSIMNALD